PEMRRDRHSEKRRGGKRKINWIPPASHSGGKSWGTQMPDVIRQAWRLARRGRLDEGLALLKGAAPDPASAKSAKPIYQRAILLIEAARWDEAAALLEPWCAHHPGDAAGALLLGRARVNQGRWDEAAETLERSLEREPEN